MSDPNLEIYEGRRLLASFPLARNMELGRQQVDEPAPIQRISLEAVDRIIIAELSETQVSRKHVRLEPLADGRVLLSNESAKIKVPIGGGSFLDPGEQRSCDLPLVCEIGTRVIRVIRSEQPALKLQTLSEATLAPGQSYSAAASAEGLLSISGGAARAVDVEQDMIAWLQASMEVFQCAAESIEFLPKAAKAAVELVALDRSAVLHCKQGKWTIATQYSRIPTSDDESWQPSQTMLQQVLDQRRTIFSVPEHEAATAASLVHVQSLVAAPFLDLQGNVLGAIYGERRVGAGPANRRPIREIDAKLVELLAYGVASGLARQEQERKMIAERVRFEQFFTPELARMLEHHGDEMLAARDADITVLFCDIRHFSRISFAAGAALTIDWVCDVLSELSDCVVEHQGVLVDYSGDALEAIWGAPLVTNDHATLACSAALKMRRKLVDLNQRWQSRLGEPTDISIGIHTGLAQVGNIGSRRKYKYGALGTTVNLASRIQSATKHLGRSLIVSKATVARAATTFSFRRLATIRTVNIVEPIEVCELCENPSPAWQQLKKGYEAILQDLENRHFTVGRVNVQDLLVCFPDDEPTQLLAKRLHRAEVTNSPFEYVWTLESK